MLEGQVPRIFGNGDQVRDYLYVGDVVEANRLALEKGSGEILNLGTGRGTSVNDIVSVLNTLLHSRIVPMHEPDRPGEVQRIYLDATRAREVLGWKPTVSFQDGLARTIEWHRYQLKH